MLCIMLASALIAEQPPGDWTGNYGACDHHDELLKRDTMNLGVRFSTSNRELAVEFARALDFWATVLDMNWHEENSRSCAIQVVDGHAGLFKPAQVARAQFPETRSFQGWIAFNPEVSLATTDLFLTAVHELGHAMGLSHSDNVSSVMYFLRIDGEVLLDHRDLAVLAARHTLRAFNAGDVVVDILSTSRDARLIFNVNRGSDPVVGTPRRRPRFPALAGWYRGVRR